eukprot:5144214-Amphidinium_carterae.1
MTGHWSHPRPFCATASMQVAICQLLRLEWWSAWHPPSTQSMSRTACVMTRSLTHTVCRASDGLGCCFAAGVLARTVPIHCYVCDIHTEISEDSALNRESELPPCISISLLPLHSSQVSALICTASGKVDLMCSVQNIETLRYYFNFFILLRNLALGLVPAVLSGRPGLEAAPFAHSGLAIASLLSLYCGVHQELRLAIGDQRTHGVCVCVCDSHRAWRSDILNLVDAT